MDNQLIERLQALIPDWEGWDQFKMPKEAWRWWLVGALMQACRDRGVQFKMGCWKDSPAYKVEITRFAPKGDWPQAIIEACAEALESADD